MALSALHHMRAGARIMICGKSVRTFQISQRVSGAYRKRSCDKHTSKLGLLKSQMLTVGQASFWFSVCLVLESILKGMLSPLGAIQRFSSIKQ